MVQLLPADDLDKCYGCQCKRTEETFCDLVYVDLGRSTFPICHSCSLELIKQLIDHYYGLWGQALMNADAVSAEREGCAVTCDELAERSDATSIRYGYAFGIALKYAAAAIRARGERER